MRLVFMGTRGNIDARSPQHFNHSVLSVRYRGHQVIIDCGRDWLKKADQWNPAAIVITHAHPDHAEGLRRGARCPVVATRDTWKLIGNYPIEQRLVAKVRQPLQIAGMSFEAFAVEHSLLAPAVGYRIKAGSVAIFYCPDLVSIHGRKHALRDVAAYIGDGATLTRSMVRKRGHRRIGHALIETQLAWCRIEGVTRAIITHCGTEIVTSSRDILAKRMATLGLKHGLRVTVAEDGMEVILKARRFAHTH